MRSFCRTVLTVINLEQGHFDDSMGGLKPKEQDVIVRTTREGIRRKSIRDWFCGQPRRRLVVPLFQRRYLWGKTQCEKLLRVPHDLGTVMVYVNDEGELIIVDGQQRATTLMLIFVALGRLGVDVHNILYHRGAPVLQPTYHDQEPFYTALEGKNPSGDSNVTNAMFWFQSWLSELTLDETKALSKKLLDHCSIMEFNIPTGANSENLQVVYERLAIRSVGIASMMFIANPGINNGVLDLTRNLFLSYYGESEAVDIYHSHWMPLEVQVAKDDPVYSLAAESRFILHVKSFLAHKNCEVSAYDQKHLGRLATYHSLKNFVETQLSSNTSTSVTDIIQELMDFQEKRVR